MKRVATVSLVRTAFKVEGILSKALGPDKFTRFMGVIIGLFLDDGPTTVQVLQAFRSCDPPASRGCYEAHAVIARPWDVGLRRVASLS